LLKIINIMINKEPIANEIMPLWILLLPNEGPTVVSWIILTGAASAQSNVPPISVETDFPAYGWGSNKGYGTKQHRDAILSEGATPHHRNSFISHMLTKTNTLFWEDY